jgi:hypothetical protein
MNTDVGLVRRFRGLRALVIGDVMLDSYLEGHRRAPLQRGAGAGRAEDGRGAGTGWRGE